MEAGLGRGRLTGMIPQRWTPGSAAASRPAAGAAPPPGDIDWPAWSRNTERKRRLAARQEGSASPAAPAPLPLGYFLAATDASFRLDGLDLPRRDVEAALARGWGARAFRPRQQQRVRNHVAILHRIERLLRRGESLKSAEVVRWYTSVACGLSTTQLDEPMTVRLDTVVRQVNSPHLRLCPAVQGIARLHRQMLADPVVPSFNGILARLLLRYHLGRCGLPPVIFVPESDGAGVLLDERRLLARLPELIDVAYATMLARE
jgi:hypothetical protein